MKKKLLIIPFLLLSISCEANKVGAFLVNTFTAPRVNKEMTLSNLGKNIIQENYIDFSEKVKDLEMSVKDLVSNDFTSEKLIHSQNKWRSLMAVWQRMLLNQIGYIEDERLVSKIHFWPKRINQMESVLDASSDKVTDAEFTTFGASKVGIATLEYLLFTQGEEIKNNDIRLNSYLILLVEDLTTKADLLKSKWNDDQLDIFSKEKLSLNKLINKVIEVMEIVKDRKIAQPSGKKTGGEIRPNEVESRESQNSLENIKNNLIGLKNLFNGIDLNNVDKIGLDDYIDELSFTSLRSNINNRIESTIKVVDSIDLPLWEAVSKEPQKVDDLYIAVRDLVKVLKVDLPMAVNETVLFSSNDGD